MAGERPPTATPGYTRTGDRLSPAPCFGSISAASTVVSHLCIWTMLGPHLYGRARMEDPQNSKVSISLELPGIH